MENRFKILALLVINNKSLQEFEEMIDALSCAIDMEFPGSLKMLETLESMIISKMEVPDFSLN
jgi:hypothetical protein